MCPSLVRVGTPNTAGVSLHWVLAQVPSLIDQHRSHVDRVGEVAAHKRAARGGSNADCHIQRRKQVDGGVVPVVCRVDVLLHQ